jgi:predicted O-methyltransferase YrrM
VKDFGAGSSVHKTNKRSISSIAVNSVKSKKYGQLLFRMVKYYKPQHILELGTSLGVTTSYLSFGNPDAKIFTLEGAESLVKIAQNNFKQLNISNTEQVKGNFDETLEPVVEKMPLIDLAFIDGNHKKEATKKYFQLILSKTNDNSILIFDDIHWSREMEETWDEIKNHSSVRCSVDLFFMGILFFNSSFMEKLHFRIRF